MNVVTSLYKWQYGVRQYLTGQLYGMRGRHKAVLPPSSPRRVLFVLTGLIGDSVMCTPVLSEARRLWPEAWITVLGRETNCEILAACPHVDELYVAPAIPFALTKRRQISALKRWMTEQCFDCAIILLGDQFAALLAASGIPIRVGVEGHALAPCLTHTYDIVSPRDWGPSERLNCLRVLGLSVAETRPRIRASEAAKTSARKTLMDKGLGVGQAYAVIHPFGRTKSQWWPAENTARIADRLRETAGWRTVLIGGKETRGQVPPSVSKQVIDTTGQLTIPELMAVIDDAAIVISTDSGPFHLAGGLGRPLIGVFRDRRPEHASRYPHARVVFGEDEACQSTCEWDSCSTHPCRQLSSLSPDAVFTAIEQYCLDFAV